MIDIVGRLPFGIGRLLGVSGPVVPSAIDEQIYTVLDLEGGLFPERTFLRGERTYAAFANVTQVGANNQSGFSLSVPFNANFLAVVDYVQIQLIAVPNTDVSWWLGNIAAAGTPVTPTGRDLRQTPNTAFGGASFQTGVNQATPPAGQIGLHRLVAVGDLYSIPGPIIVTPTSPGGTFSGVNTLMVITAGALNQAFVSIGWRERPIVPNAEQSI
jgi:hypothetical protein